MTVVAEVFDYVIGTDTHAQTHTYAIINTKTGAREACEPFPATPASMRRAIAWITKRTTGTVLAAVEGTRSYGATITHALTDDGSRSWRSNHRAKPNAQASVRPTRSIPPPLR